MKIKFQLYVLKLIPRKQLTTTVKKKLFISCLIGNSQLNHTLTYVLTQNPNIDLGQYAHLKIKVNLIKSVYRKYRE